MPGKEPEKNPDENLNKLGSGNQSEIALRFANSFSGRSDIGAVISQIECPLTFPSRATAQKPKETQGQWYLTYFRDDSMFNSSANNVYVKIPLLMFDPNTIEDARAKGQQEFTKIVQAYIDNYNNLNKLHEQGEYAHPPRTPFEMGPSNMSIVFELSTSELLDILHAEKTRNAKKVTKKG